MLEERGFEGRSELHLGFFALFGVKVELADLGGHDVLQQPVHGLVVVEHDEELNEPGKVDGSEELADEAELAEVDDKPRLLLQGFLEGKVFHDGSKTRLG